MPKLAPTLSASILLTTLLFSSRGGAQRATSLVLGMDHIPVVVADLEQAEADYHAMGFSIKPGRVHSDGIRNAHVKFPDGTEIELISPPAAVDALTAEYKAKLKNGDGPVYFGLYAPDQAALAATIAALGIPIHADQGALDFSSESKLHPLFFGGRNKSPTDKPEHFAHANSAERFSAVWVSDNQELRGLLQHVGIAVVPTGPCAQISASDGSVATLPEGNLYLVPSTSANVVAARVEVRNLATLRAVLKKNSIPIAKGIPCDPGSIWISPVNAHGIWLEFVESRR